VAGYTIFADSMIRDARVLRAGFVPREIEHRDAEVNHLSSVLEAEGASRDREYTVVDRSTPSPAL
jgi:Cdc6-like AAA superfamily ATPase